MSDSVDMKIRTDKDTRDRFAKLARDLGMNASTAMNVFMRQFVSYGGFPFEVAKQDGYVPTEKEFAEEMNRRLERMMAGHRQRHDLVEV